MVTTQKSASVANQEEISKFISPEGLQSFLASPYVKGIGTVYAARIVDAVGAAILDSDISFDDPSLSSVGLTPAKAEELKQSFLALKIDPSVAAMLYSASLKDVEVEKILSHYGKKAAKALIEDPYDMVENVWKVSFFTADKLGKWLGVRADDPRRIRGAALTAVKFYAEKGNLFATEEQVVKTTGALTGASQEEIRRGLETLIEDERLVKSREGIYLPVYFHAEKQTAKKLAALIRRHSDDNDTEFEVPDKDLEGRPLNTAQKEAIRTVMSHPVTVITGGPGTGKTTAVRGIVKLFEDMDRKAVLVAPTGRAAKRLSDLSGTEAKTIHRLLGYSVGRGYRNKRFDAGILVIDEASMLEQVIFSHLLDAIDEDTKIVLVGDTNQLPAIGAGDVLNDLIRSGAIPVVNLTENFRQKAGSDIAATAEGIKRGIGPRRGTFKDFILVTENSPETILERVLSLVGEELPRDFGVNSKDIQVVSPQQDGPLGARELNVLIQQRVNPSGPALHSGKKTLRLGDRVMQTSNASDRNVYNGETGWISEVDESQKYLEVTFHDGKKLRYGRERLKELTLSYATTVHKLQGSETDYMVMVLSGIHKNLLYRNLLYTGVSRARKLCVLVGEERAIETALANDTPIRRNSNFGNRLRSRLNPDITNNASLI